jgi:hypothetical protein
VEPLVLLALLASTFVIAFAGAKIMLALILHLMAARRLPFGIRW